MKKFWGSAEIQFRVMPALSFYAIFYIKVAKNVKLRILVKLKS